jgi:hypothetical protein
VAPTDEQANEYKVEDDDGELVEPEKLEMDRHMSHYEEIIHPNLEKGEDDADHAMD